MRTRSSCLILGAALTILSPQANAGDTIISVGPSGQFQSISDAVTAADADTDPSNYYIIYVAPGTYTDDSPFVTRPMTIAVDPNNAGQVLLQATRPLDNKKGIILTFASLTVNGLTFMGAMVPNELGGNGAGIRDQNEVLHPGPATLIVENSTFIGNQAGILTGHDAEETIVINNSQFINNGNPDQNNFTHALYVNGGTLTVSNSLFCGQLIGQNIKSRARATTVVNNRIYDGEADPADGCGDGSSSLAVDLANGGVAVLAGNQIIQGPATQNYKMVSYGAEGLVYDANLLSVSNNVFTNIDAPNSIGIYDPSCVTAFLFSNTFQGVATPVNPPECAQYE